MKISYIILAIFIIVSLTSCTSTDKADVNEFIKRYNNISEYTISKENFIIKKESEQTKHSVVLQGKVILTLVSDENNEIKEYSISVSNNNNNRFIENCICVLRTIYSCDIPTAEQLILRSYNEEIYIDNYKIKTNYDNLQTTSIITHNEYNKYSSKTLKEKL